MDEFRGNSLQKSGVSLITAPTRTRYNRIKERVEADGDDNCT